MGPAKIALVTGASRGVGASVAQQLAQRGVDIAINYRNKGARAEAVAAVIRAAGRDVLTVQADLTLPADRGAMMTAIRARFGRLDVLILNASGGLEKGKPSDYPWLLNVTAQVELVNAALPLMGTGSRVVFVTSHLAHFHDRMPVAGPYEPVAASKHAGEQALRARTDELRERGVGLVVVSGDMIEGTITPRLLERMAAGTLDARRRQAGGLPTIEDFACAISDAALREPFSDATVFVGATE